MKSVWFVQDYIILRISEVFTTKKAAFAEAKKTYGQGRFRTLQKGLVYYYHPHQKERNPFDEPACIVQKVPLIKAERS